MVEPEHGERATLNTAPGTDALTKVLAEHGFPLNTRAGRSGC